MKRDCVMAVLLGCTLWHSSAADSTDAVPVSGIITSSNGVIVFDGINTRHETSHKGVLETVAVTGDSWWLAFPASGRIILEPYTWQLPRSYPDSVKWQFQSWVATNAVRLGEETVRGFPCWKYRVNRPRNMERRWGVRADPAPQEVIMHFLANPNFPLVISPEIVDVKLNCPVPPGSFKAPAGLEPAKRFDPKPPFLIEHVERRQSTLHGWSSIATNTFFGKPDSVVLKHTIMTVSPHGTNYIGPKYETNQIHVGLSYLNAPAGAPYWGTARFEGRDTLLNLPASIFTNTRIPGDVYWVVNHPQAGTFSARHVQNFEDLTNTNEITRLEFGP